MEQYNPHDTATLVHIINTAGIKTYLVNKNAHPKAFSECTMKFVADTTFDHLKKVLNDANVKIEKESSFLAYVLVRGPKENSSVYIDALGSMTPLTTCAEINESMTKGIGAELLEAWQKSGLLARVFPELEDCVPVDGGPYHEETVFKHLMDALRHAKDYPVDLQWAVLLHDIGKPATVKTEVNNLDKVHTSFHSHEVIGASIAYSICKRFNMSKKKTKYIVTLVRHHMFRFQDNSKDKTIKKWLFKVGKHNWRDLFELRIADRRGNRAKKNKPDVTIKMKELQEKILELIGKEEAIFKEDLNISENAIKTAVGSKANMKEVYSNLIGLINADSARNTTKWLTNYINKIYG